MKKMIAVLVAVVSMMYGVSVSYAEEVVTTSAMKTTTRMTEETIETEPVPMTFWEETGDACASAGEATWSGIKTGAKYTGKGLVKCGVWIKDGTLYLGDKVGLHTRETEIEANERIIAEANKTLVQSKARRDMRTSSVSSGTTVAQPKAQ